MGNLKMTKEGYIFISDNDIMYGLYEGLTVGTKPRYTSDILFVVFDLYDAYSETVGIMYGAGFLDEGDFDDYTIKYIDTVVSKWESEHPDIVKGIKDGTIVHY